MNDYSKSICFSDEIPVKLNELSFKLDKRLFLFAYYEPKRFVAEESNYSIFRTAITNMYGLIKDCCPFLNDLIINDNGILSTTDEKQKKTNKKTKINYADLYYIVNAFRTIFCHNCSPELRLNAQWYREAEDWASENLSRDVTIEDIKENEWGILLARLTEMSQQLFDDIERNLISLFRERSYRRQAVIRFWISAITNAYCRNTDYLLHSMAALYDWYVDNDGDTEHISIYSHNYRTQVTQWLQNYCDAPKKNWHTKWLDSFDWRNPSQNRLYGIIYDWPNQWAKWYEESAAECDEPPLPGGILFRLLASDVDDFAAEPSNGYKSR